MYDDDLISSKIAGYSVFENDRCRRENSFGAANGDGSTAPGKRMGRKKQVVRLGLLLGENPQVVAAFSLAGFSSASSRLSVFCGFKKCR